MEATAVHSGSPGNTRKHVCLVDGRRLLVTKDLQGVEVSQVSPRPDPLESVWRQDYAPGPVLESAYRRIVMLLNTGRSIAKIAARENLPGTLRANRVAAIVADLCREVLDVALTAVRALQKDPLNTESLGTDPKTVTRDGTEATFEYMAFLMHAAGRAALAILGPAGRDELMDALGDSMIAEFTRVLYGRRIGAVEHGVVAERLTARLADREAEYEACPGADRPGNGQGGALLWKVGTRTAALLGRTNEIEFIDGIHDQMTACMDGLHLAARLQPLREPDAGVSGAPATPHRASPRTRSQPEGRRPRRSGAPLQEKRPDNR